VNGGIVAFDMACHINNKLAECRAAKGINKSQLAIRLDMSRAYGDIRPSIETAMRIARYFKKPVEDIFQLVEEDPQTISRPCPAADRNSKQCRKQ
jgi:putative transcriptional regulator